MNGKTLFRTSSSLIGCLLKMSDQLPVSSLRIGIPPFLHDRVSNVLSCRKTWKGKIRASYW